MIGFVVMAAALVLLAVAYAIQGQRVEDLEGDNTRILADHKAIGAQFAEQTERLAAQTKEVDEALRAAYARGFLAGQRVVGLPAGLRPLARYASSGMLVPRRQPQALSGRPRVASNVAGYAVRWRSLALFASRIDSVAVWTRQALGPVGRVTVGAHRVRRFTSPSGVTYAWRTGGVTYAVLTIQRLDGAARVLISSMR